MKELITAVNAVMKEAKSVSKNSNVGTGRNAYKGVRDIDVKELLQPLMAKHELAIFQTGIDVNTDVDTWEQEYNGQMQRKKQVFTEVQCKYTLVHSSGQTMDISGLGYGVDSQDKGAGKAQTYALKMALLYTFLIPTGDIDDTDNTHSDDYETPNKQSSSGLIKPAFNENATEWFNPIDKKGNVTDQGENFINACKAKTPQAAVDLLGKYKISKQVWQWVEENAKA